MSDWWTKGQRWLEEQALEAYQSQKKAHLKKGRSPNTFRYSPPEWQQEAVKALGENNEEYFKSLRLSRLDPSGKWREASAL